MHLKLSSGKYHPFCLDLNVFIEIESSLLLFNIGQGIAIPLVIM